MHSACFFALVSVSAASLVANVNSKEPEYCQHLTNTYMSAWEFADSVVASCNQERGPKNCMVFGTMWSSNFRNDLSKISAALGCGSETAPMDLETACSLITNIGQTSTKVLREIFQDMKGSKLSSVADEVIPDLEKMAQTLVKPVKADFCNL